MIAVPGELLIQNRLGLAVYRRALAYHRAGAIQGGTREGGTLRAQCVGTAAEPYRLWATLDDRRVVVAHCSCPVGASGRCKHVGALLLAWKADATRFREHHEAALDPLGATAQDPVLEELADAYHELGWLAAATARPGSRQSGRSPTEVFQLAARRLLGHGPASYEALQRVAAVRAAAERALVEGQRERAAVIYEGLLRALLERPDEVIEGGPLVAFSVSCVLGLGRCLQAERSERARGELIKALYFAFRSGAEAGGLPLGGTAGEVLRRGLYEGERAQVLRWLQGAATSSPEGVRQLYGALWLRLEAAEASPERLLQIARWTGRVVDAVDRLLLLGRVDEARSEARGASPDEAVAVARCFVSHGHRGAAVAVLESVPADDRPVSVLDELTAYQEASGELRRAMAWGMEALRLEPTVERYREVKRLGGKLGQWPVLRLAIEAWLLGAREESMLASVYLDEGAYDEALSLAERSSSHEVKEAVAQATERHNPRAAMAIYRQIVEQLVSERGREGYQQARKQLQAMKRLHGKIGEGPSWATLAARLRARAPSPPLRAAG